MPYPWQGIWETGRPTMRTRLIFFYCPALVRLHRYTGLLLSGVLFIAGLTGSISVFRTEIDAALNPDLFHAPAPTRLLPVSTLLARLKLQRPETQVTALLYRPPAGRAIEVYSSETVAGRTDPVENEIFLDPGTGRIQGIRLAEGCCFNRRALMSLYIPRSLFP